MKYGRSWNLQEQGRNSLVIFIEVRCTIPLVNYEFLVKKYESERERTHHLYMLKLKKKFLDNMPY